MLGACLQDGSRANLETMSVTRTSVFLVTLLSLVENHRASFADDIAKNPVNLTSAKAGAKIVASSSNYGGSWDVENLIASVTNWSDASLPVWCTAEDAPFPHWAVIELPRRTWLTTLMFNNSIPDESGWEGISAKGVEIYASQKSSKDGFSKVASFVLERNKNDQLVRLSPTEARWIKIVITSNWGNASYTELGMLGTFDDGSRPTDVAKALSTTGTLDVYGIYFDFASTKLRDESAVTIDAIAKYLKDQPKQQLAIEGHTDIVGDAKTNQTLSEGRAKAVVAAVVAKGIEPGRLQALGYGATKPIADNKSLTGRAKNRRVTLRVKPR